MGDDQYRLSFEQLNELKNRYPEVAPFLSSMLVELANNSHKGDQDGWRQMSLGQLWNEITWHAAKLGVAIKQQDEDKTREYAADVANMSMMLVDVLNLRGFKILPTPNLDPWPLEYPDGSRARDFEGGVADHLALDGKIYLWSEIGAGLEFKPRLGFDQIRSNYRGVE